MNVLASSGSVTETSFKPFHLSVIEMIEGASRSEMELLERLLLATEIQSNHAGIIGAWRRLLRVYHIPDCDYHDLFASLNRQRKLAIQKKKGDGE